MAGTGFNPQSGVSQEQINNAYNSAQSGISGQQNLLNAIQGQNGLQNQSNVYGQLQKVASGQGPNPAQAMLNQATGANVANQAALMGGQRGASQNVGLLARQAGQQGANLQQQAAGQGATMQANQSLGALGQAGNMANTMAGNQIGQTNALAQSQQAEQQNLLGANAQSQAVQGQIANTQAGQQGGLLGGAGNAIGAIFGAAEGGQVPMYADGGSAFNPQSMFGQFLSKPMASTPTFSSPAPGKGLGDALNGMASKLRDSKKPAPLGTTSESTDTNITGSDPTALTTGGNAFAGSDKLMGAMNAAKGGKVPAMVSPGEKFLKPEEAVAVAEGKADPMKVGETIPGKAKVKGDSYENDTVRKDLDAGGIVVPRHVMNGKHAGFAAKKFVEDVLKKGRS